MWECVVSFSTNFDTFFFLRSLNNFLYKEWLLQLSRHKRSWWGPTGHYLDHQICRQRELVSTVQSMKAIWLLIDYRNWLNVFYTGVFNTWEGTWVLVSIYWGFLQKMGKTTYYNINTILIELPVLWGPSWSWSYSSWFTTTCAINAYHH